MDGLNRKNKPFICWKETEDSPVVDTETVDVPEEEPLILCRQCGQTITRPADRISVNGAHRHIFANPHGYVFEIGCFHSVTGCAHVGAASGEFTWFTGYLWRTVVCTGCLSHLGWSFSAASGDVFFGLILDQLIIPA